MISQSFTWKDLSDGAMLDTGSYVGSDTQPCYNAKALLFFAICMIIDVKKPKMDGYQLVQRLREDTALRIYHSSF